jgi:hypothetical protein
MKSKVSVKKLSLNKKTVADLNSGKMREVYGGEAKTRPVTPPIGCTETCSPCPTECTRLTGIPNCPCVSVE